MPSIRDTQAIEAALALFWRKGYGDTSMAEIVEVTGMNRYALYSTFGNKREIFLAALEVYFEEGRAFFEPMMRDPAVAPLDRIAQGLEASSVKMAADQQGCFICHVAAEHRSDDPKIAAAVTLYFEKIRACMEIPLREAAEAGGLNPALTPECAAQLVFDAKMSMGVHARAGAGDDVMRRIIAATLAALRVPVAAPVPATAT
ncbi:MAG: TetR/AcrR family transcriptional regulator [Pseudomonadota bacterium]